MRKCSFDLVQRLSRGSCRSGASASRRRWASTRPLEASLSCGHAIDCFMWGKGGDGALGLGGRGDQRDPEIVEFDDKDLSIVALAAGAHHSAAVDSSGELWTWGKNSYGVLGTGDLQASHCPSPRRVSFPEGAGRIVGVDCGDYHTAAITEDGSIYTWGWAGHWFSGTGALGHGSSTSQITPKRVEDLANDKIVEVACGKLHSVARTENGKVFSWGCGEYGRLGLNSNSDCKSPQWMDAFEGHDIASIAVGSSSSAAITKKGELFVWGKNDCGQLGVGSSTNLDMFAMEGIPTLVEDLREHRLARVACSNRHMVACTCDGRTFVWGDRQWMTPFEIKPSLLGNEPIVDVGACSNLSAVVTESGRLLTWGSNTACLGHGDWDTVREPTLVEAFEGRRVLGISASNKHMGALVSANE